MVTRWRQQAASDALNINAWQLLNSLSHAIFALDKEARIVAVNDYWTCLSGIPKSQTLRQPLAHFIHPEDINCLNQALLNVTAQISEQMCLRVLHKGGEIRWCELRMQSIKADSRYPLTAALFDITPQFRREQIKEATHRSLLSLTNRMPAMLYRARNNRSWTMEYVSEGCQLITGYPAQSLLNHADVSLGELILQEDASQVWTDVQKALQQHRSFDLSYRIRQKSGDVIRVRDKGHGLYSASGVVLGVEGIILAN